MDLNTPIMDVNFLIIFIFVSWVYSELRLFGYWKYKTSDDFELKQEEVRQFKDSEAKFVSAENKLSKAQLKVQQLEQMGKNLRRNKDGKFDARSRLGQRLNHDLPEAESDAIYYTGEFEAAEKKYMVWLELPKTRKLKWAKMEAKRGAKRGAVIFSGLLLTILVILNKSRIDITGIVLIFWFAFVFIVSYLLKKRIRGLLGI